MWYGLSTFLFFLLSVMSFVNSVNRMFLSDFSFYGFLMKMIVVHDSKPTVARDLFRRPSLHLFIFHECLGKTNVILFLFKDHAAPYYYNNTASITTTITTSTTTVTNITIVMKQ